MDLQAFEQDRKIDPEALDVEVTQQADLFFKWAERYAKATSAVEMGKVNLDALEARLQLRCRMFPAEFNLVSVTETSIKAAVLMHEDFIAQQAKYHGLKADKIVLEKVVETLDMKKRMLELLVTLHGQEYFAGPSSPRDLASIWNKKNIAGERQNQTVRKRGEKKGD